MSPSKALILNPHAGKLRGNARLLARLQRLAEGRARCWITSDQKDLDRACAAIASGSPDRVLLCGGDGTFMAGVTALWRAYDGAPLPTLLFAPAGTVCTLARRFSGRTSLIECVRSGLETSAPPTVLQPTLRVEDGTGRARVGFTFGTGLIQNFFEHYESAGAKGRGSAAAVLVRVALGSLVSSPLSRVILAPIPCRVEADGDPLPDSSFSLIVASVLRNVGLSIRVTYRAGEDPARPHVVASSLRGARLAARVWRVMLGLPLGGPGGFDDLVDTLGVRFSGEGRYVLDGELLAASQLTVTAGPTLRVMVPVHRTRGVLNPPCRFCAAGARLERAPEAAPPPPP